MASVASVVCAWRAGKPDVSERRFSTAGGGHLGSGKIMPTTSALPITTAIPEAHYMGSRREYKPHAWIPELLILKTRVEEATPEAAYSNLSLPRCPCNAVLCNLYRHGNDIHIELATFFAAEPVFI